MSLFSKMFCIDFVYFTRMKFLVTVMMEIQRIINAHSLGSILLTSWAYVAKRLLFDKKRSNPRTVLKNIGLEYPSRRLIQFAKIVVDDSILLVFKVIFSYTAESSVDY